MKKVTGKIIDTSYKIGCGLGKETIPDFSGIEIRYVDDENSILAIGHPSTGTPQYVKKEGWIEKIKISYQVGQIIADLIDKVQAERRRQK